MQATLVIRFGSLGDVVLTSPAVLNLKIDRPHAPLVYLTKERFRPIVSLFDGVDDVVTVPDHASPFELFAQVLQLEDRGFDRIVDLHGNIRSWFVRTTVTANRKAVYPKRRLERNAAARRHQKRIPPKYPHTIDQYNKAVAACGAEPYARRPMIFPGAVSTDLSAFIERGGPIVLIAPGAAHPNKQWPVERFVSVADLLRRNQHARVIWAVTSNDPSIAPLQGAGADADSLLLIDHPLPELAALLARADLTISNDSGVGHLSSAVDTPTLAIFGPTHPVLGFAPRGLRDCLMQVDESCRPCSLHGARPCFREERFCFTRISVDAVHQAAIEMLREERHGRALLIDRDGTLIQNKHYLSNPDDVELIDGSIEALLMARRHGFRVVVVSNQSGVARGLFPFEDIARVNGRIAELLQRGGAEVDAFYSCPHLPHGQPGNPYVTACECRKPAAGMAEQAALEFGLDLRGSVVIGDSLADMQMARVIGARRYLVRTGYGNPVALQVDPVTEIAENLLDAVRRVVQL